MSEKNTTFFKQTKVAALVLVALLVIVATVIAVLSTFSQAASYQQQTPQVQTLYTQQPSYPSQSARVDQEDRARVMEEDFKRKEMRYGDVPPCVDPCNVRVEYTKQYFLPYPRYTVDHYYYKPYPVRPHDVPTYYPIYQRFFHHRIVEQEFGY